MVWLAGESHRFTAIQEDLIHNAFETAGGARFGAAIPTEPARLVQSASGAVKHGLDRFVHEWTMGLAGEMSRHEKAELDELRREVNAARMRAFRVIGALHAREVAQHDYILNRLLWRDWRARRVIASYDAAPPERVQHVLAEAARATCGEDCLATLSESASASAAPPTPKLRPSVAPVLAATARRGDGTSWTTALAAPAYARPSVVERDGRACRNWPVSCRVPAS